MGDDIPYMRYALLKVDDIVMHLPRRKMVRILGKGPEPDLTVQDVMTGVRMLVPVGSLSGTTYNEMEALAWAMDQ